jgi:hypothetical protein
LTKEGNSPVRQDAEPVFFNNAESEGQMGELTTTTQGRGLALQTFDDAMRFGKLLADSDFPPKDFRGKPASCVLAVQHGAEVGLGPMQAIQSIAVINGRPSIWGDAALALVMASPVCEYVKETIEGEADAATAMCTAKRKGYPEPVVVRFSMADAKRAGLAGKSGPWSQYPKRMLQLRARGFALRDAFPDVLKGLVTAEEAQDYAANPESPPVVVTQPQRTETPASQPAPQPVKAATDADMVKAKKAINATRDVVKLGDFLATVTERYDAGFYSTEQCEELRNLIDVAIDVLNERDEVTA